MDSNIDSSGISNGTNISYIDQAIIDFEKAIGLSSNTRITVNDKKQINDSEVIYVTFMGEYPVKSPKLSNEILVSTPLSAEIHLDKEKKLMNYHVLEPNKDIINSMTVKLNNMVEKGDIELLDSVENRSASDRFKKGTEFYIEKDDKGQQHLRRSHFSSR